MGEMKTSGLKSVQQQKPMLLEDVTLTIQKNYTNDRR